MTNPTLERAARALVRALYEKRAPDDPIFYEASYGACSVDDILAELVEHNWPDFVPEARAVLMAVREPTPKMVNATWNHPVDRDGGIESQNTRNERVYKAMIDAILGGGEGE